MLSAIDVFVSSHRRCRNDLISRFGAFRTLPIPAGGRARTPSPGLPTVLAVNLVLRSAISATQHLARRGAGAPWMRLFARHGPTSPCCRPPACTACMDHAYCQRLQRQINTAPNWRDGLAARSVTSRPLRLGTWHRYRGFTNVAGLVRYSSLSLLTMSAVIGHAFAAVMNLRFKMSFSMPYQRFSSRMTL